MKPSPTAFHCRGTPVKGIVALAAAALLPCAPVAAAADGPLELLRITPAGWDVPAGRQIVLEFDRPVVAIGRMARDAAELPISIDPPVPCQWRWLNRRALACNLGEADRLAEATRYVVEVAPGIETLAGSTQEENVRHEFVTERPRATRSYHHTWRHPGVPVLRVSFNQPVSRASVEEAAWFETEAGLRRGVRVSAEEDSRYGVWTRRGAGDWREVAPSDYEPPTDRYVPEARRQWLVEPEDELPPDSRVTLNVGRGLQSVLGPMPGPEMRAIVRFDTFPELRFLGVDCRTNDGEAVLIPADGSAASASKCDPLTRIGLAFSAPVLGAEIEREVAFSPDLAGGRDDYDPWARQRDWSRLGRPHRRGERYIVRLPERLKAFQRYEVESRQGLWEMVEAWWNDGPSTGIRDEFARPLVDAIDMAFWTDRRRPNAKLTHREAVLEAAVDSEVPLYVTNLGEVTLDYRLVGEDGVRTDRRQTLRPTEAADVAFAVPLGVRPAAEGKTGAIYGHLSTVPPTRREHPPRIFAQVTPYQVHVKLGHFNTLVWVTDLETGEHVEDAAVSVYRDSLAYMGSVPPDAPSARTDADGVAILPGTQTLDPDLYTFTAWRCRDACDRLFVRVDGARGMALLPLIREFEVGWSWPRPEFGHMRAWGTTAQGVYRAGDTIEYKIYVRDQSNERLVPAKPASYSLRLEDPTGKTVFKAEELALDEFGTLHGEYAVHANAVMGWYRFVLAADFTEQEWRPLRVLVTDFTPAPFRVATDLSGELFRPGDELAVQTSASLHSGGPYTDAETRVTLRLAPRSFRPDHRSARGFHFTTSHYASTHVYEKVDWLAEDGRLETRLKLPEQRILRGRLRAESAVRDDRGKYVAAAASADYSGLDRWVGLRKDAWVFKTGEEAIVRFIVVDDRGEPVPDTEVAIGIERLVRKAARVKGAGNAYLTRHSVAWEEAGNCAGTPAAAPMDCRFVPALPGEYRLRARIEDTKGREHETTLHAWAAGQGVVVWDEGPGTGLTLEAEKTSYGVGETARVLVKNPFPGATALVTVERHGILKRWRTTLEGSTPIIEFPIEPSHIPGAFLSVTAFSPRVAAPPGGEAPKVGEVDLGKPAFRIGYLYFDVLDPHKQLAVSIETDRTDPNVYRPGETVALTLSAKPQRAPQEGIPREPIEYAVAVLDEAVFDLIAQGKDYFDPYKGFYPPPSRDVANYNLLTRIVGRQKFEQKGANPGGDGGQGPDMRSIFKYVAHWAPSLRADAEGNARLSFELPDNLTGWRVLALAATPTDRFGLGDASFKTSQPTQIRPVMPNQVSEGDRFVAGFSVMNRTAAERALNIAVAVTGDVAASDEPTTLSRELRLAPYKRETIYLPATAAALPFERDAPGGELRFEVRAWDDVDGDALMHSVPVRKRRTLETAASYGSVADDSGASEPIHIPADAAIDTGSISVALSPSAIGNVEGAFRYMRDYPYLCWEQVLAKGVMASHFNALRAHLALDDSLAWPGSAELPAETLARAAGHQTPSGGMAYWIPTDDRASAYLSAYTALAFNWLRAAGHEVPETVEGRLHTYLGRLLRRNEMPTFYSRGMASTVRAVALNALAGHGKVSDADLLRYAGHVQHMDLFGAANYLDAALRLGGKREFTAPALDHVLSHRVLSGGKLAFNQPVEASYRRILATQLRSNCALLSAFSRLPDAARHGLDADAPMAMARSLTQARGNREHWENTQENVFCMNALIDYARRWERNEPAMRVAATLGGEAMGSGAFASFRDQPLAFSMPITGSHPGTATELGIRRAGVGRLYYAARIAYAPKAAVSHRVNAGIDVRREYSVQRDDQWVLLEADAAVARGELVRVDLFLELPTARNFVVVDDPVAGGLEPVNRALATASEIDADAGDFDVAGGSWWSTASDWIRYGATHWSFYHRELRHDAVRFYADYLPPGRYHLSYTAQAIAAGEFSVGPARASEMYDIDIFGTTRPLRLTVAASP